jgi:DNA-binding NarL/FixJ family response regulator
LGQVNLDLAGHRWKNRGDASSHRTQEGPTDCLRHSGRFEATAGSIAEETLERTRVLVIEDNRLLREGIAATLDAESDFEVIAVAEDGDALQQLKEAGTSPHVVLLDLGLEKTNSLQLMSLLTAELPDVRMIAMDILPEQADVVEFVEAGGSGFILKTASPKEYVDTIRAVANGDNVLPAVLTASLFTQIVESALESGKGIPESAIKLTAREREIVDLIAEGLSNKEIAVRLHIATQTVKSHVHNVLEKLTLSSRLQIAAFAHRRSAE